jgi:uncharacterized protein (DUF488 family)
VTIFTVGHSTHPIEMFLGLLAEHFVSALADVRSAPYSRFNPQFNRESLQKDCKRLGVGYVFLGRELGARSDDASCYKDGRVQYARLAQTRAFLTGIDRVIRGAEEHRIALVCAEKDPLECHRTILVARALAARGADVQHILADGRLESHDAAMDRLLDCHRLPHRDLFRSREDLVTEALARQEERVAYVDNEKRAAGENR